MPSQPNALPPSEKPQGLFEEHHNAAPRPPVRLESSSVTDCKPRLPIFTIATRPVFGCCLPFGKRALSVTHSSTKIAIGLIRFSRSTPSTIWLETNGRPKYLRRLLAGEGHPYWKFSLQSVLAWRHKRRSWFWEFDEQTPHAIVLVDRRGRGLFRNVIARIDGDVLSFVDACLGDEDVNVIVVGAVALAEHTRMRVGHEGVVDVSESIGSVVGEFPASSGGNYCFSDQNAKLRKERRRASRYYGDGSGGIAFAGFAAAGGVSGGCDGGGGGGCC